MTSAERPPARVVVRRARRADLDAVLGLLQQDAIRDRPEDIGPPAPAAYVAAFEEIDRNPNELLLVAEVDGHVVGTAQLTFIRYLSYVGSFAAQVESVHVDRALRSRGVGAELMKAAEDEARRRGASRLQLTSNKVRRDAHRFYERLGFKATHEGFKKMLR